MIELIGNATLITEEDGGMARIVGLYDLIGPDDEHFFVRLQSWDETGAHETLRALEGKRLRIRIEILEEPTR